MTDKNLGVYNSKKVVSWYSRLKELIPVEKMIFERYKDLLADGAILDIGIGGGRTTNYLLRQCKNYTGIDYSGSFIASVKQNFPDAQCFVMDARDLRTFKNASFDLVNFSFNGIDYVDNEGRKKILSEISRILTPGGIFFFSTHNKNHRSFNISPWRNKDNSLFVNVKTFIKLLPFFLKKIWRKKQELINEDYAIINDSAHNYNLTTYYTTPAFLRKQLAEYTFSEIEFYLKSGEKKEDGELDDWIFVSAKKFRV